MARTPARGGFLVGLVVIALGGTLLHGLLAEPVEAVRGAPSFAPMTAETGRPVGFVLLMDGDEPGGSGTVGVLRVIDAGPRTRSVGPPLVPAALPALLPSDPSVGTSTGGIVARAGQAYVAAARLLAAEVPGCRLEWQLLAAIGRVESNHGTFGGSRVGVDGMVAPPIIGIPLDGRPGIALVRDSDGGTMDGDLRYDRAVGPMQFLPQTWRALGGDADGDRTANVHDIDDAAYGAGRLLCRAGDLSADEGRRRAVFRYNPSLEYVVRVLGWYRAYVDLGLVLAQQPDIPGPTSSATPSPSPSATPTATPTPSPSATPTAIATPTATATPSATPTPSLTPTPTPTPTSTPTSTSTPAPTPSGSP